MLGRGRGVRGAGAAGVGEVGAMEQDQSARAQFGKMAEGLMADPSMRAMVEKTAQDLQGGDQGDVLERAREMAEKTAAENPELLANLGIEIPDDAAETIQSFGDAVKFITEAS